MYTYMNNTIYLSFFLYILFFGNVEGQENSSLILDEQFTGTTKSHYEQRGWYDGTGSIGNGYKFEYDSILDKNVMYAHWSTPEAARNDPNQPDGAAAAWRFPLSPEQTKNGVTFHVVFKTHNLLSNKAGNAGQHWLCFGQNFSKYTPINSQGELMFDLAGTRRLNDGVTDPSTGRVHWETSREIFYYSYGEKIGNNSNSKTVGQNYLNDDVWYEVAAYIKVDSSGGKNTSLHVQYRPWSTTKWHVLFETHNQYRLSGTSGQITQFMISPYTARFVNDIRSYLGFVKIYNGNAIVGNIIK